MLFNSTEFIFLFLPFTFFIYFYLNSKKLVHASKAFLVVSSLCFYGWWSLNYLPILLTSLLFNYTIGVTLSENKFTLKSINKKTILILGILANICLLAYFKYTDFFIDSINLTFDKNLQSLDLILPLAISFFTFQQIAYLVDSYKGLTKEHDFLNYTVFVTFFPQLIAGPIVHHKEMMPQFACLRNKLINYQNVAMGMFIFSIGLFKKLYIADSFGNFAAIGFNSPESLSFIDAWATSLSYTFQIYFDFSAYTDMAIGLGLLFNIKLPINFYSPYKSTNIQDFWRRWHITLSRFLKDYVYIPLGGSRKGNFKTYNNLIATFLLGGLWHGAGFTFIAWGAMHGVALIIHRVWQSFGVQLWSWLAWVVTFNFINISWVYFRAENFNTANLIVSKMFEFSYLVSNKFSRDLANLTNRDLFSLGQHPLEFIVLGFSLVLFFKNSIQLANYSTVVEYAHNIFTYKRALITSTLLFFSLFILIVGSDSPSEFLYFNF